MYPRWYSNLSTARISPMLPSWIRSSSGRPRLVYFLAMLTTRRRLASMSSFLPARTARSATSTRSIAARRSSSTAADVRQSVTLRARVGCARARASPVERRRRGGSLCHARPARGASRRSPRRSGGRAGAAPSTAASELLLARRRGTFGAARTARRRRAVGLPHQPRHLRELRQHLVAQPLLVLLDRIALLVEIAQDLAQTDVSPPRADRPSVAKCARPAAIAQHLGEQRAAGHPRCAARCAPHRRG